MPRPLTFPDFAALELEADLFQLGGILYRPSALVDVCTANGMDPTAVLADQDRACAMIASWYLAHRERGGRINDVAEAVLARIRR